MLRVFSFLFVVTVALFSTPRNYLLVSTKQFTVHGSTSIGGFECNCELDTKDTLFYNTSLKGNMISHSVSVKNFGCGNFLLNNDFRKTLKEKEYPNIGVELANFKKNANSFTCDLTLMLVGKKKMYKNLPLKLEKKKLKGNVLINFSDFDLTAPKKMGGMIKIKEKINLIVSLQTE